MVRLIGQKAMNHAVSHTPECKAKIHKETEKRGDKAARNLTEARNSTRWHKIYGPDHLTETETSFGDTDGFVSLIAPNPMAIEFGHQPSGVFGPGGSLGHIESKAPDGLYIISRAAGLL